MFYINNIQVKVKDLLQWPSGEIYEVLEIKEHSKGVILSLKQQSTGATFRNLQYPKRWVSGVKFVSPTYKQDAVIAKIKYLDERYKTHQLRKKANESSSIRLGDNNLQQGESVRYIQSPLDAWTEERIANLRNDLLESYLEYANRRG